MWSPRVGAPELELNSTKEPALSSSKGAGNLRLLALDLGERRIGLAVSDAAGSLVFPAGYLLRTKFSQDLDRVLEVARDRDVQGFVVGVPYTLSGEIGLEAKRAQRFIRALQNRTTLPVYSMDERFTSLEAEGLLREAGRQPSREKGAVDEAAAALILQRYLNREQT